MVKRANSDVTCKWVRRKFFGHNKADRRRLGRLPFRVTTRKVKAGEAINATEAGLCKKPPEKCRCFTNTYGVTYHNILGKELARWVIFKRACRKKGRIIPQVAGFEDRTIDVPLTWNYKGVSSHTNDFVSYQGRIRGSHVTWGQAVYEVLCLEFFVKFCITRTPTLSLRAFAHKKENGRYELRWKAGRTT